MVRSVTQCFIAFKTIYLIQRSQVAIPLLTPPHAWQMTARDLQTDLTLWILWTCRALWSRCACPPVHCEATPQMHAQHASVRYPLGTVRGRVHGRAVVA